MSSTLKPNGDINLNTYNLLFTDSCNEETSLSKDLYFNCRNTIEIFTKLDEKKLKYKLLKYLLILIHQDLKKITYNKDTKEYEYRDNNFTFNFDMLSNYVNDNQQKKELLSNKRYRECHSFAQTMAPTIESSKVVTGLLIRGNERILHSVIEFPENNRDVIIDYTKNLYMKKNQYIALNNFIVLSSFPGINIIDDLEIMVGNIDIKVKAYLTFRNELIKDMQKNPHIFMPTEEGKKLTKDFREANK